MSICCEFHACLEAQWTFSKPRAGEGGTFVRTILEIPKKVVENRVFASPCPFLGTRFWTTFLNIFCENLQISGASRHPLAGCCLVKLNCLFVCLVSICCEFHACLEACVTFSKPRAGEGGTDFRDL